MTGIQQIKQSVKISSYFDQKDLIPNGEGKFKTLSPFNKEDTPSFFINTIDGIEVFKDFSSGAGGDIFSFLQKRDRKSFIEVYNDLSEELGLTDKPKKKKNVNTEYYTILSQLAWTFNQQIKSKPDVIEFLKNRGITEDDINTFNLGWVDNGILSLAKTLKIEEAKLLDLGLIGEGDNGKYDIMRYRITIPLYNDVGQIVGISTRKFLETDKAGKYINPTNNALFKKNSFMFGFNIAKETIKEKDMVILCEGYFDFIQLYKAGFTNSVCVLGTALMSDHVKNLSKLTNNFYFCFDGDVAGENSVIKNAKEVIKQGFNLFVIELPKGEDPDSYVIKYGTDAFKNLIRNAKTILEYIQKNDEIMIAMLEDLKGILPKITSSVKKQLWYKNVETTIGIDLTKDLKKEFFEKKQKEELTERDILFITTLINADDEGKKRLLENEFFQTEKAKYLVLKLTNKIYDIAFTQEENNLIKSLTLKKQYDIKEVNKIIKRVEEEKRFNG